MKRPLGLRITAMIFSYLALAGLVVLIILSKGMFLEALGSWVYIVPMVLAAVLVSVPRGLAVMLGSFCSGLIAVFLCVSIGTVLSASSYYGYGVAYYSTDYLLILGGWLLLELLSFAFALAAGCGYIKAQAIEVYLAEQYAAERGAYRPAQAQEYRPPKAAPAYEEPQQAWEEPQQPREEAHAAPNICPGCGAVIEPGTHFCTNCGAQLNG